MKKKVVDYTMQHGTRPAARLFNISEGTIRSWKLRGFDKQIPVVTRGRKVTYGQDLDEELYLGLMAMLSEKDIITVDQFTDYAKKIIDERRPELNFKCSRGWIDKFLNRHNLVVVKSEVSKVMHIVERQESEHFNSNSNDVYYEVESGLDVPGNNSTVSPSAFVLAAHLNNSSSASSPDHTPQKRDWTELNENGNNHTPNAKYSKTASGYNSYLQGGGGGVGENLSEKEQKKNRDAAKSLHVIDIVEKLDVISYTNTSSLDPQRRLEVIQHATVHGSRSAERLYGVPETTVKFWLKKASIVSSYGIGSHAEGNSIPGNSNAILEASGVAEGHPRGHAAKFPSSGAAEGSRELGIGLETKILAWALERRLSGEVVTFDGLCDQALSFVSQGNPSSAYSSTRRWVEQFLNLNVKDALSVQM